LRVWSKSKNAAASVVGSVTTKSIGGFLDSVLNGKVKTQAITAPPLIIEGGVKIESFDESAYVDDETDGKQNNQKEL